MFGAIGRGDLVSLSQVALGRIERPTALVCIVGEFKQGKSSLVNELVGLQVCPVDDDLATSVLTLVHHAERPVVRVHRRSEDTVDVHEVSPDEMAEWVTERGNAGNQRTVERVEVGVSSRFLERGPALIDTPGSGGLSAGAAAAVLAFLPFADAMVFVTDASSELSATEIDYLRQSAARCPCVLMCLTKTDIYPEWRRIRALNVQHLHTAGLEIPIFPVSSTLRGLALQRSDRSLNDESGFPALLQGLDRQILSRVKQAAASRAIAEVCEAAASSAASLRAELAVLDDPARLADTLAQLESARAQLEVLKGPAARWSVLLNDRVTDLGNEVNHLFRTGVRSVLRDADEAFEKASSQDEWKALVASSQQQLALLVGEVFRRIDDAHSTTRAEIAGLLRDDVGVPSITAAGAVDFGALWLGVGSAAQAADRDRASVGDSVDRSLNLVRGAYGATAMFGILARLLPATAAAMLLSNPFTLGAGTILGVRHAREQRRRRTAAQRQQARASFRSTVEQIQTEVAKAIGDAIRDVQRALRDDFTARIQELQRVNVEVATRCQEDVNRDATWRQDRRGRIVEGIDSLDRLAHRAAALEETGT